MALRYSSGNETVDRVGQIDFNFGDSCNLIMSPWYDVLRYDNGKVNLNACVILSEIVYWYRPTVIRDEVSGRIIEVRTKFKADKLQKNYQELADQFGLSKRQVTDAVVFLEHKGLVKREFRNVITETGLSLANVLFLDLNVDRLIEISFPEAENSPKLWVSQSNVGGVTIERDTPHDRTGHLSHSNGTPLTSQRETYTYTTTKTTTETTSSSSQVASTARKEKKNEIPFYEELIADNIQLDRLLNEEETENGKQRIWMLYKIICKTITSKKKTEKINSEEISREEVKNSFLNIGYDEIRFVCDKLDEPKETPIYNLESYIKTLLYNAPAFLPEYKIQKSIGANSSPKRKKNSFNNYEQREYDYNELEKQLVDNIK